MECSTFFKVVVIGYILLIASLLFPVWRPPTVRHINIASFLICRRYLWEMAATFPQAFYSTIRSIHFLDNYSRVDVPRNKQ